MKLVAIGVVERRTCMGDEQIVTAKLTYFARMSPAATFADQASARAPAYQPLSQALSAEPSSRRTTCEIRRELMDYPTYQQQGWPIGSGSLKGPGMHWRSEQVNPMLALRLALLNGRWSESWQEQQRLRQHHQQLKRQTRQQQRYLEQKAKRQQTHPPPPPVPPTPKPTRQKTGRTEAQGRWGRQTFSSRLLKQADGAKK